MKNSDTRQNAAASASETPIECSRKPTKLEQVLGYLIEHGSITPAEALNHCNCWRLAPVVHTLKKSGIPIETQKEEHEGGTHARYWLLDPPPATQHLEAIQKRRVG